MSAATRPFAVLASALLTLAALGAPLTAWQPALLVGAVLLALPHGALDATLLRYRFAPSGLRTYVAASIGYVTLATMALLGWLLAPPVGLAVFLLVSAWHFGSGDGLIAPTVGPRLARAERVVRGALVIVLPFAFWPDSTRPILATLGGDAMADAVLSIAVVLHWPVLLAAVATVALLLRGRLPRARPVALEIGLLVALFVYVPPLVAFAAYFVALHAQRHLAELAGRLDRSLPALIVTAVPATLASVALAALFWIVQDGAADERLWRTVFIGLAAVTVPHMVFERTFTRLRGTANPDSFNPRPPRSVPA